MITGTKIIEKLLGKIAQQVVKKHQPQVVAVTGTVGKTSTKEAIAAVLASKFQIRKSMGGYNTEIGLPLSILGLSVPKNKLGWLGIIGRAVGVWLFAKKYPGYLVLEMGADHPGDLAHLSGIAPPDVAVVTNVDVCHREYYPDKAAMAAEKSTLVRVLKKSGLAILNNDDDNVRKMAEATAGQVMYYGLSKNDYLYADEVEQLKDGLQMRINYGGQTETVKYQLVGKHQAYVLLPAIAVGLRYGLTLAECLVALREYRVPVGRMSLLPGKNEVRLIDSSYNSSPLAAEAALHTLAEFPGSKVAVLGDMRELGEEVEGQHQRIGALACEIADRVVTVGPLTRRYFPKNDKVVNFEEALAAAKYLEGSLSGDEVVLIKGSQNTIFTEEITARLLDPQLDAAEVLCRQDPVWRARKAKFFVNFGKTSNLSQK